MLNRCWKSRISSRIVIIVVVVVPTEKHAIQTRDPVHNIVVPRLIGGGNAIGICIIIPIIIIGSSIRVCVFCRSTTHIVGRVRTAIATHENDWNGPRLQPINDDVCGCCCCGGCRSERS